MSDGDAKAFKHLCDRRVYGNVELKKEECIKHVAKRIGTALRKLRASSKKVGVVMGGRGHDKLTLAAIDRLEGKAVRGHPNNLDAMRDAVWATFYHATSTDSTTTAYKGTHSPVGGSRETSERSIRATLSR